MKLQTIGNSKVIININLKILHNLHTFSMPFRRLFRSNPNPVTNDFISASSL